MLFIADRCLSIIEEELKDSHNVKSCEHFGCTIKVFSVCVWCEVFLCYDHFIADDPCSQHNQYAELVQRPTTLAAGTPAEIDEIVATSHFHATMPAAQPAKNPERCECCGLKGLLFSFNMNNVKSMPSRCFRHEDIHSTMLPSSMKGIQLVTYLAIKGKPLMS
eukprot:XP_011683703.1 PREDICTED: uncharacterized protein LOC105447403 isoform X1 [Strongylocentrotus purpuratus]